VVDRCAGPQDLAAPTPLRRLSRWEYDNVIRDLLGDTTRPAATTFPEEERVHHFDNHAAAHTVSPLLAERYVEAAEAVASRAVANLGALTGCDPAQVGQPACARAFIARFGRRAYRRPLRREEVARLEAVYAAGGGRAADGYRLVVATVLQSAPFLYRVEEGTAVPGRPGLFRLGSYEIASRLSFFLWGSAPDETLLDDAERGALATPEGRAAAVRRLLSDRRARAMVRNFHEQWLGFGDLPEIEKDTTAFPAFATAVPAALHEQAMLTVDELFWGERASLRGFLTSAFTFGNAQTAKLQGLTGPTGSRFERIELDPTRYAGVLTSPPLLTLLSTRRESSPIARGLFTRERLFCQELPTPPGDVPPLPSPSPGATTRERFAQHTASPECAGCHRLIDPVGFGLEGFDAVGRHRTSEGGKAIDTRGELAGTDVDGPFDGAVALAGQLVRSGQVRACVARHWVRYAFGRDEAPADGCLLARLEATLTAPDGAFEDVLTTLAASEAFTLRVQGEER
jgi:hypothetical protein